MECDGESSVVLLANIFDIYIVRRNGKHRFNVKQLCHRDAAPSRGGFKTRYQVIGYKQNIRNVVTLLTTNPPLRFYKGSVKL